LTEMIKNKPPALLNPGDRLPGSYAMAVDFPLEADRLFDGELNLLLMDGLFTFFLNAFNIYIATVCWTELSIIGC
jgi:hypothetical protein